MPHVQIRGGAEVEIPNLAEIRAEVGGALGHEGRESFGAEQRAIARERELEYARGIKWMRIAASDPASPTNETIYGPDLGYVWKLRRFAATLTAADSVAVYVGDTAGNRLIAFTPSVAAQTSYVIGFSPEELLIGGESVYVTTTGTGHFSNYYLSAWQVPEEMAWKLL
jgi:hypothetical protein